MTLQPCYWLRGGGAGANFDKGVMSVISVLSSVDKRKNEDGMK